MDQNITQLYAVNPIVTINATAVFEVEGDFGAGVVSGAVRWGDLMAAPGPIGGTTPADAAFEDVVFTGNQTFSPDNSHDIGDNALAPRLVYTFGLKLRGTGSGIFSIIRGGTDGVVNLLNTGENGFDRLIFGGGPAICKAGTIISFTDSTGVTLQPILVSDIKFSALTLLSASVSGTLVISDVMGGASAIIQFGGIDAGHPGIFRSGTDLWFKFADGTGWQNIQVGTIVAQNMPTSASGQPSGTFWNNSGVINIV